MESLKRHHISRPRNPLIADVCFKAGYIDSWGRGTLKIYEACKEGGLPEPEITSLDGGILVTLFKRIIESPYDQFDERIASEVVATTSATKPIEDLQKEFGLLSDRLALGKEVNSAFLRANYGVFTEEMRKKYGRNTEEVRKKYGRNAIDILMLFMLEQSIRSKDIAIILGLGASTIEKVVSKFKDDKVIERVGSTKSGYWKIIEQK